MPVLSRDNLREQLKRREIAPVYTLYGDETYLRDAAAKYLADICFSDRDLREFNETEYSLTLADNIKPALAAAAQLPMMAARRVVRITDVRVASTSNRDTLKEDAEQFIAAYLADPSESSVVIFIADELNANRKIGRLLKERSVAVDFARLDDGGLRKWAADHLRDRGAEADQNTLRYLIEIVGNDVRRLTNEVNKLSAAALPGKTITPELINALAPNSREISNFSLTDYLVAGRKAAALRTLKKVLDDGIDPLALLGLISSNYRRLLIAGEMTARGASRNDVISASKAPYGAGQEAFLAAARRIESKKLARAIGLIARTDLAIKTSAGGGGPAGARLQIEMLVCELAML